MKIKIEVGEVEDNCGNIYKTVKINNQEWLAENLKTDILSNGDKLLEITPLVYSPWNVKEENQKDSDKWHESFIKKIPAYTYLNSNSEFNSIYGKLYNYWSIADNRGIGFKGFRMPKTSDFEILKNNFVTESGRQLKSKNISGDPAKTNWCSASGTKKGNDKILFNALPSGLGWTCREQINGMCFDAFNKFSTFWIDNSDVTKEDEIQIDPFIASLFYGDDNLFIGNFSEAPGFVFAQSSYALSIRLVRDL